MKTIKMSLFVILLIGLALIAAGCVGTKSGTFAGETKPLGNGMVRSWSLSIMMVSLWLSV